MPSDDLIDLWSVAGAAGQRTEFEILRAVGRCYVALSPSRTPALIIPLGSAELPRGRVLGSVRLRYEPALRFDVEGKSWSQPAAVIDCLDMRLVRTFVVVVRDLLTRLAAAPNTAKQVSAALAAWDELLRRRTKLTDASELGLWGELFVLGLSSSRDAMVAAWRGPLGDSTDFFGGGVALECKTSSLRHQHRVSHRQASFDGEYVSAYIVSIWACEDATGGKSLADIVDELTPSLHDEATFLKKLMAAGYREEHRPEYQRRFHCPAAPKFFRVEHVPRVRSIDDGITNVRYEVDLGRVPSVADEEVRALLERMTRSADQ